MNIIGQYVFHVKFLLLSEVDATTQYPTLIEYLARKGRIPLQTDSRFDVYKTRNEE